MTDHYSTLGVQRGASADDIKKAYRKMASQHHPDKGGDTQKFQQVEEAYRTLSDPTQRQQYDNPQPQGFEFHFGGGDPFGGGGPHGFENIFRHFGGSPFGDMFGQRAPARNRTLSLQTQITLEDAFYGKELVANITLPSGRDQVMNVKIPAGVKDGTTLRLAGMGDDSISNMPRGDIHLAVSIAPHEIWQRHGDDLLQNFNITVWEAMLGESVRVRTIDGKELDVTIPQGAQTDQVLSVQGCGMPMMNDTRFRGRLLLKLKVLIPDNLNESQKNLIRQAKYA
jgi:curved DNA-binding protein